MYNLTYHLKFKDIFGNTVFMFKDFGKHKMLQKC